MSDHTQDETLATSGPASPDPNPPRGPIAVLRAAFRVVPRFFRSSFVFLVTSFLTNVISAIITENTSIKIDQTQQLYLNVLVGALLSILFWVWDGGQQSLRRLTERYANLESLTNKAYERGVDSVRQALLGSSAAKLYADLASPVSDPLVGLYVALLNPVERLEARAASAVEEVLKRLKMNNWWYPILTRFLRGEETDLRNGRFSLSLKTYLDIYLDLIRLYIDRAENNRKHLHIWSFTNAIPTDWLAGDSSVSGNIMKLFADEKMELIDKMRQAGHVMRMISLALDHPTAALPGIRSVDEVRQAWARLGEKNRSKYLNQLHTASQEAFVARLQLDDLEFFDGMAEFVFFGLGDNDTIAWDLCIAGGFSSQNQVLRAHYLFLAEEERLLLDIPNKKGLKPTHEISAASRLRVSFRDWPKFAFTNRGYGAIAIEPYEHLLSFADKWRLAAEVWHTDEEREQVGKLLEEVLRDKTCVLDAAAGTGFHCEVLKQLGKKVSALEVSQQELELFKQSTAGQNVTIIRGDWRTLLDDLNGQQFEAMICLGSSIPYHSTWGESRADSASDPVSSKSNVAHEVDQDTVLRTIIANFRRATKPGGVLVLGLSRHNERNRNGVKVGFTQKLNGVSYDMQWRFDFDWQAQMRKWYASIQGDNGEEYAFELVGHLFDHDHLAEICRAHFAEVELRDIAPGHYDKYLVCRA